MGFTKEERTVINDIIDEALEANPLLPSATQFVLMEMEALESQGHGWAADYMATAMRSGISARVRSRSSSKRVAVGQSSLPANYATALGLCSWLHVPVDELDQIVDRLNDQAETLTAHAEIVSSGQEAAKRNGKATAAEGFAADGITITEAAA